MPFSAQKQRQLFPFACSFRIKGRETSRELKGASSPCRTLLGHPSGASHPWGPKSSLEDMEEVGRSQGYRGWGQASLKTQGSAFFKLRQPAGMFSRTGPGC